MHIFIVKFKICQNDTTTNLKVCPTGKSPLDTSSSMPTYIGQNKISHDDQKYRHSRGERNWPGMQVSRQSWALATHVMAKQRTMAQAMANFCWDLPFLHKQQTPRLGSGVTSVLANDDSQVMSVRSTENLKIKFMYILPKI